MLQKDPLPAHYPIALKRSIFFQTINNFHHNVGRVADSTSCPKNIQNKKNRTNSRINPRSQKVCCPVTFCESGESQYKSPNVDRAISATFNKILNLANPKCDYPAGRYLLSHKLCLIAAICSIIQINN